MPSPKDAAIWTSAETDHARNGELSRPNEEELQEILEILREARRGLTEDSISAVMVLRREIAVHQAVVNLLLEGKIEAWVIDKTENEVLTSRNFQFRVWPPDDEPGQTDNHAEPHS